jgi:membrane-bound lytic murein transglycosylase D
MTTRLTAILFCLLVSTGCAVFHGGGGTQEASPAARPDSFLLDPRICADYRNEIDAAAALYAFGEVDEFVAMRDSIRAGVENLALAHPFILEQPEFVQLLDGVAELDSLYPSGLGHAYLAEDDSLAMSTGAWPETPGAPAVGALTGADTSPFPAMMNDRIDFWIRYFTGTGRERFQRALYRMQLHRPTIERILDEQQVHQDMICVALIESGFDLKARSYARAVGPWQFIAGTARIYGLRVDWWYDERRDIVASTYAATNYLKDLYGLWNDWLLALAAYNCGEYRVARAMARQKTQDFWSLDLPSQTERYVPKFLASLYIVRDPAKYGFTIPDVEPVSFDEVAVKDATDLKLIAEFAGTTADYLEDLNPAILRWCTPPQMEIAVKVPVGTSDQCASRLAAIPPDERVTWRKHQVKPGETLSQIADRYHTEVSTLKTLNRIKNAHTIRAGSTLIVPMQGATAEVASSKPQYREKRRAVSKESMEQYAKRFEPPANFKRVSYVVKKNDTLGEIAEAHRTSTKKVREWNNLSYRSYIHPGQELTIFVPESFDPPAAVTASAKPKAAGSSGAKQKYTVKKGDTLYSISKKFNVKVDDLAAWNGKSKKTLIHPGDVLVVRTGAAN